MSPDNQNPENSDVEESIDLEEEVTKDEVASRPTDTGDPEWVVEAKIPADIRERYEVHSYRNAAVILSETRKTEFDGLLNALREFRITTGMIRRAGGNESEIPKLLSSILRPLGWHETIVQGDLIVKMNWHELTGERNGKSVFEKRSKEVRRDRYLDGHKIDYVKDRVAFDLEWNSADSEPWRTSFRRDGEHRSEGMANGIPT